MFNVCPNCGEYRPDKTIAPDGVYAICPNCGFRHKFIRLPLFILTGASGVGKSTVCLKLAAKMKDVVVMESDILWRAEFNQPETNYLEYRETWLRVCKNISQAGRPVVLCGVGLPNQFEPCVERRYFSELHYLALTCDPQILVSRLRSRPKTRGTYNDETIKSQVAFNRWLLENAQSTEPPMTLLDTSEITVDETAEKVERWLRSFLNGQA
ncbi:MAG TPA: AAA family ATPase [Pyrinomonadaceae bacterium]|nr:AAA family ATPase [Pyrinomonadaceae bacterium]